MAISNTKKKRIGVINHCVGNRMLLEGCLLYQQLLLKEGVVKMETQSDPSCVTRFAIAPATDCAGIYVADRYGMECVWRRMALSVCLASDNYREWYNVRQCSQSVVAKWSLCLSGWMFMIC